ncbi:hypothetical protein L1887_53042 [Cichorium endivia]|nr:hypothetical protein L1887_53042 [Cichorium endivia]
MTRSWRRRATSTVPGSLPRSQAVIEASKESSAFCSSPSAYFVSSHRPRRAFSFWFRFLFRPPTALRLARLEAVLTRSLSAFSSNGKPSTSTLERDPLAAYKGLTFAETLEDLSSRFIVNLPSDELSSIERICFQVEQAHWFYEDFLRPLNSLAALAGVAPLLVLSASHRFHDRASHPKVHHRRQRPAGPRSSLRRVPQIQDPRPRVRRHPSRRRLEQVSLGQRLEVLSCLGLPQGQDQPE